MCLAKDTTVYYNTYNPLLYGSFFRLSGSKFAYLKVIDDRLHAEDRTYANEKYRRHPLGLESKLNKRRQE